MQCRLARRPQLIAPAPRPRSVDDLEATRSFYGEVLRCPQGREATTWIDWDLYGHQLVTHLTSAGGGNIGANPVDGLDVPVPHFGVLLDTESFHQLAKRLRDAGVEFVIEPYLRFAGHPGEQWTMFFRDPAGNALEFKAFADDAAVFAR